MNKRMSEAEFATMVESVISRCDQSDPRVRGILDALNAGQMIIMKRLLANYSISIPDNTLELCFLAEELLEVTGSSDKGIASDELQERLAQEIKKARLKKEVQGLSKLEVAFSGPGLPGSSGQRLAVRSCVEVKNYGGELKIQEGEAA